MIKKLLTLSILLGGIFMIVVSCLKDSREELVDKPEEIGGLSVDQARLYFESAVTVFEVFPFTTPQTKSEQSGETEEENVVYPLWDRAEQFLLEGIPTIEIPYNYKESSWRVKDDTTYQDKPLSKRLNTSHLMVIQTDPSGEITPYSVMITAADNYLRQRRYHISRVSLSSLENFSGEIRYFTMAGEFIGGYVYRDGIQVGRINRL